MEAIFEQLIKIEDSERESANDGEDDNRQRRRQLICVLKKMTIENRQQLIFH